MSLDDVCDSRIVTGNEFQTLDAEDRKSRDPKVMTGEWKIMRTRLDDRRDLVCSCMLQEVGKIWRATSICKALKVKVASLIGSQWSCLRSSLEDSGEVRECWFKITWAAACWIRWRRAMCLSKVPYKMEFNWSRREEISANVSEPWCHLTMNEFA